MLTLDTHLVLRRHDSALLGCKADILTSLDVLSTEIKLSGFEMDYEKRRLFSPKDTNSSEYLGDIERLPTAVVDLLESHIGSTESQEGFREKINAHSDFPSRTFT